MHFAQFSSLSLLARSFLATLTTALPAPNTSVVTQPNNSSTITQPNNSSAITQAESEDRYVFCHFMVGIIPNRVSAADYDDDMKRAKAAGIDAFALNIGTDDYTHDQLSYAYESAANNDMKAFISFDFSRFKTGDVASVASLIRDFGSKPGQMIVDDKVFVSTFIGDALDVGALRAALSDMPIYFVPNFNPTATPNPTELDGAFNWMGWNNDGKNKAPKPGANVTVKDGDDAYKAWLGDKDYMAPVSPWFSTHYGTEVTYSKNWVFPGDLVWFERWNEILASPPRFLEIQTWNDYGESHYIGPLSSIHTDDGNSKWAHDMPHNGWLDMAKPFIAAYKAGASSASKFIEEDQLIYWYRPTKASVDCDATDTTMDPLPTPNENYFQGRPNGYETMEDSVFVVSLLKEAGTVTASSGKNTNSFEAPAGASAWKLDMSEGQQKFSLERGGQEVLSNTSLREISDVCPCGIYNFNAYVGTVPAGPADALRPDALSMLQPGLKVECKPTGTAAATTAKATGLNRKY